MLLALLALLACASAPEPPSIVLISLDTLRADRVGAFGGPPGLTPNLDRLAAQSVTFTAAYSQANETLFSHGSLLTGRYASSLGALSYELTLPRAAPTLAEVLALYGYRAGAAVGGLHMSAEFGFDRGFEEFAQPTDEPGSLFHTLPAALRWLDGVPADQPFFLLLHGYDAHARYLKPPPYAESFADPGYAGFARHIARLKGGTERILGRTFLRGATLEDALDSRAIRVQRGEEWQTSERFASIEKQTLTDADIAHLRAVYDGAVAYLDAWVGIALAELEARDRLEDALIVVISDHGEHLGEGGVFGHRYTLDDTSLHVPLIIRLPGGRSAGHRVEGPVGLIDLVPTLLELAGAAPPAGMAGLSLVGALDGGEAPPRPAIFSEGMFRQISARGPQGRLTFAGASADSPFLAELVATARLDGPAFSGDAPDRAALRGALAQWRAELAAAPPLPQEAAAGRARERLRERLREEGYWR